MTSVMMYGIASTMMMTTFLMIYDDYFLKNSSIHLTSDRIL